MARLGLEIPPLAKTMRAKQTEYKDNYNALQIRGITLSLYQVHGTSRIGNPTPRQNHACQTDGVQRQL